MAFQTPLDTFSKHTVGYFKLGLLPNASFPLVYLKPFDESKEKYQRWRSSRVV